MKHLLLTHLSLKAFFFLQLSSVHFTLSHFSAASFSLRIPASLTAVSVSHGNFVAVCVFFIFFQFCCFTSVKSGADVHIIPYNALVISCVLVPVSKGAEKGFDSTGLLMISYS